MTGTTKLYNRIIKIMTKLSYLVVVIYSQLSFAEEISCTFLFRSVKNYSAQNQSDILILKTSLSKNDTPESTTEKMESDLFEKLNHHQIILNAEIKYLDRLLSTYFQKYTNSNLSHSERKNSELDYQAAFQLQGQNFRQLVKIEQQLRSAQLLKATQTARQLSPTTNSKNETIEILNRIANEKDVEQKTEMFTQFLNQIKTLNVAEFTYIIENILPSVQLNSNVAQKYLVTSLNKKFKTDWRNLNNIDQISLAFVLLNKIQRLDPATVQQKGDLENLFNHVNQILSKYTLIAQGSATLNRHGVSESHNILFRSQLKTLIAETLEKKITELAFKKE